MKIRINNFDIFSPKEDRIIVQGLEMLGVKVTDRAEIAYSYKEAVKEAKNIALFLSSKFSQFSGWAFEKAADEFYVRETRHYKGEYLLSVNEILENECFPNTAAMGSYPVQIDKLADNGVYVAGKPVQYGIPLGCMIPLETNNLLMTGSKISYSSLAASSAGTLGTGVATGQTAGIISVYCIINDIKPSDIEINKDEKKIEDLRSFISKQGMNFPEIKISNKNASNWSYPAVRELLVLGLIAGGTDNNFSFDKKAKQEDLTTLLLNGIYRLNKESYTLQLDKRLRPYFNKNELTLGKAADILAALNGGLTGSGNTYSLACSKRYINDFMQLRLKNKKVLTLDDVYYLSAYNIKLYTGKDIKD